MDSPPDLIPSAEPLFHPDPVIDLEVQADALAGLEIDRAAGVKGCAFCEVGWPRLPDRFVEGRFIHNAVMGDRRIRCGR